MTNKNAYKEKIYNFTNYLYSKDPVENMLLEAMNFENISSIGNVEIRGFYSNNFINAAITDEGVLKKCEGIIGEVSLLLYIKTDSLKTQISGGITAQSGVLKRLKLVSKFNGTIINNLKVYEKITSGTINKNKISLKSSSKFLHREGTLSRTFTGTLNDCNITININDLGQIHQNKTLITGTVTKDDIIQSFNFNALWKDGYGYIQQIEGFLLPILIYPLI